MTLKYLPALLALAWSLGACGGEDEREAEWAYIAPAIIIPNCATSSCHSEAAAAAGLDMSTAKKARESLLDLKGYTQVCDQECSPPNEIARPLIMPGNPSQSRTVHMMRARGAERMPPDRPLPEADIALFERWVLEGARP